MVGYVAATVGTSANESGPIRFTVVSALAPVSLTRARHAAEADAFSHAFSLRTSSSTVTPSVTSARRAPRVSQGVSHTPVTRTRRPATIVLRRNHPSATNATVDVSSVSRSINARSRDRLLRLRTTPVNVTGAVSARIARSTRDDHPRHRL